MNSIAQMSPYEFCRKLMNLTVPGYEGYPGGAVAISEYLSANTMFGGNSNAGVLAAAFSQIAKANNQSAVTSPPDFSRVFTGQGSCDNFIAAMSFINQFKDKFKAVPGLKKYFDKEDFLQAMVDDKCFGLDCIGFVGNYLVEAGLEASYVGRRPLDYAAVFKPVKSLAEVKPYGVVMLTNGMHIQMIDTVNERGNGFIKVDLCQSSSGGPQCNVGVTIRGGGGDCLDVDKFRAAVLSKSLTKENDDDNETRKQQGLKPRDYESYLRSKFTTPNTAFGFGGGAIFTVTATGEPGNPVSGSVYIGAAGISIRVPS
jgi:hypothetical protein